MAVHSCPAVPCPYAPGDWIVHKYLLERMIGAGGMCTVWVAVHAGLDRKVAVKFLRSDLPESEANRLLREARAEARLEHPAIVRVFDYGETERGHPFIVMELLDGESMADALYRDGPLSPTAACRMLLPIVDGLAAAHESGVVHRDLKPENVFLAREGGRTRPKLLDFGIAKLKTRDPSPSLTLRGAVLGSPAYMAPEQARGQSDVDHRSDVWAACMVLYEAVAGHPPFRGENYNAILRNIIEDEVPPLVERGAGEAALFRVLSRGLVKNRDARFQSMRDLWQALSEFLIERGIRHDICGTPLEPSSPPEPAKRSTPPLPGSVRAEHATPKGGTLEVHTPPPGFVDDSALPVVRTRPSLRSRKSNAFAMRTAAVVAVSIAALFVPKAVVDSPFDGRVALERARRGAVGIASMLTGGATPEGAAPAQARTMTELGARGAARFGAAVSDGAMRPREGPACDATPIGTTPIGTSPPPASRPSYKSARRLEARSNPRAVVEPAPFDANGPGRAGGDEETLRALGLKAPYR